jgi:pyruvate ferredoxin oxidoreductase gamma subunit
VVLSNHGDWQVRFHGRGGQGVVTAAELLSIAAFYEGYFSQAFPTFGSERAGAPVTAFCRISDRGIRTRSPITAPDVVVVQDPTLLNQPGVFAGLGPTGRVLVNTSRWPGTLGLPHDLSVVAVPATEIAQRLVGRPVPNAALLGGLAAAWDVVGLDAVLQAISERFDPALASANCAAAAEAYGTVARRGEEALLAASD